MFIKYYSRYDKYYYCHVNTTNTNLFFVDREIFEAFVDLKPKLVWTLETNATKIVTFVLWFNQLKLCDIPNLESCGFCKHFNENDKLFKLITDMYVIAERNIIHRMIRKLSILSVNYYYNIITAKKNIHTDYIF